MLCGLTLINKRYSIARRERKEKGGLFEVLSVHLNPFRPPQNPAAERRVPRALDMHAATAPTKSIPLNRGVQEISQVL